MFLNKDILSVSMICFILLSNINTYSQNSRNNTNSTQDYSGKFLLVKSVSKVKGKKLKEGDQIKFVTAEPFTVDGVTLVNKETSLIGHVVSVKKPRSLGREGKFEFVLDDITLSNNKLKFINNVVEGKNMLAAVIVECLFLGPIPLLFQGTQGIIKKGAKFSCYIQ